MIVVHVPTHPHVQAYLEKNLPGGAADKNTPIGVFLIGLLGRDTNRYATRPAFFQSSTRVMVPKEYARRQGARIYGNKLNETQAMELNAFVGKLIGDELCAIIATYLHFDPRLKKAKAYARAMTQIDEDAYSEDALDKRWQRWRKANGGPCIYAPRKESVVKMSFSETASSVAA